MLASRKILRLSMCQPSTDASLSTGSTRSNSSPAAAGTHTTDRWYSHLIAVDTHLHLPSARCVIKIRLQNPPATYPIALSGAHQSCCCLLVACESSGMRAFPSAADSQHIRAVVTGRERVLQGKVRAGGGRKRSSVMYSRMPTLGQLLPPLHLCVRSFFPFHHRHHPSRATTTRHPTVPFSSRPVAQAGGVRLSEGGALPPAGK